MLKAHNFDYTKDQIEKIRLLRILIETDAQLEVGTDNVFLSKFLYSTQWNIEKAYESIHRFYDFKIKHPDWLAQGPLSKFEEFLHYTRSKFLMPKPDRDGRVLIVFKVVDVFDKFPNCLEINIQLDDMIFESVLLMEQAQKHGLTIIYDLTHMTKNIARVFSPSIARILNEKNNVLPWTTKRVHYIQKGVLMNTIFAIFKSCLNKKLREQIFSHDINNLKQLHELIGYENVPAYYGGPAENVLDENLLYDYLKENEQYLLKMQCYHKKATEK